MERLGLLHRMARAWRPGGPPLDKVFNFQRSVPRWRLTECSAGSVIHRRQALSGDAGTVLERASAASDWWSTGWEMGDLFLGVVNGMGPVPNLPAAVRFPPGHESDLKSDDLLVPAWSGHRMYPPREHRFGLAPEAAGVGTDPLPFLAAG